MAVTAVTVAVARLLIEDLLAAAGDDIRIEHEFLAVNGGLHRRWQFPRGRLCVESGHGFGGIAGALIHPGHLLLRLRRGELRNDEQRCA